MGSSQAHELIFWLLPIAVVFGVFHHFFSHTKIYERLWFIPAMGFAVTVAAVYFEKFDDCQRYPFCVAGWAERHASGIVDAKLGAGPLIDLVPSFDRSVPEATKPSSIAPAESSVSEVASIVEPESKDGPSPAAVPPTPITVNETAKLQQPKTQSGQASDPVCPVGLICSPPPAQPQAKKKQPTAVAAWTAIPPPDPMAGLKSSLKLELRRLNCLKGGDDASWGKDTVAAINRFNIYGYTKASVEPDAETLQMLRGLAEPVCP